MKIFFNYLILSATLLSFLKSSPVCPEPRLLAVLGTSGDIALPSNSLTVGMIFTIYYEPSGTDITLAFKFNIPGTSFSFGWGTSTGSADYWTFDITNNIITVSDRWITTEGITQIDTAVSGTNNIVLLGYEVTDSYTLIKVKRALSTGDTKDRDIVFGANSIIWAYRSGLNEIRGSNTIVFMKKSGDISLPGGTASLGTAISLYWETRNRQMIMVAKCNLPGIAFMVGFGNSITSADIWSFEIIDNAIVATDRWSSGSDFLIDDTSSSGANDLTLLGYEITESYTLVKVRRNFTTGDSLDNDIKYGHNMILWAYNTTSPTILMNNDFGVENISITNLYGDVSPPTLTVQMGSSIFMNYEITSFNFIATIRCIIPNMSYSLGIGTVMTNADIWSFEIIDEKIVATDMFAPGRVNPVIDTDLGGTSDLIMLGYEIASTYTTVKVTRKLNTNDPRDRVITMGLNVFLWAFRVNSTTLAQHTTTSRGTTSLLITNSFGDIGISKTSFNLSTAFTIYYEISFSVFTASIQCNIPGVAFSIGWGSSMANADIWSFEFQNNGIVVTDMWSEGQGMPSADTSVSGNSDVILLGYEITNTYTLAKVSRSMNTGDTKDNQIFAGINSMIWAYTEGSLTLAQHSTATRGNAYVTLIVNEARNLRGWVGLIMFLICLSLL